MLKDILTHIGKYVTYLYFKSNKNIEFYIWGDETWVFFFYQKLSKRFIDPMILIRILNI